MRSPYGFALGAFGFRAFFRRLAREQSMAAQQLALLVFAP
jgi:hypothetical protein